MSTSENPPLTRKQLRELRNTGATPVVPPADAAEDAAAPAEDAARPAAPVAVPPAPAPDAEVDLGVNPLTRRQARQQERIRTASIPVVAPDVVPRAEPPVPAVPAESQEPPAPPESQVPQAETPEFPAPISRDDAVARPLQVAAAGMTGEDETDETPSAVVNPAFGSGLLAGGKTKKAAEGASFDQLVARSGAVGGSVATPNALILSQSPASAPLVAPITATGELLVTGTFALPDGLGSHGHVPGTADGAEADVVLVDGELPASSSPMPIAASAAISTVKDSDEIIRPPAPERGSRLMLVLAITAGALALALVGVLILAFVNGVFS